MLNYNMLEEKYSRIQCQIYSYYNQIDLKALNAFVRNLNQLHMIMKKSKLTENQIKTLKLIEDDICVKIIDRLNFINHEMGLEKWHI